MTQSEAVYDSKSRITMMTAIGVLAPVVFLLVPYISEALGATFGWNEAQRAQVASVELIGMAIAAFSALFWIKSNIWRPVVICAITLLIVGNLLSSQVTDLTQMSVLRFILGLIAGTLSTIYCGFLSYTKAPDRNASILVFCQVILMVLSFIVIPKILGQFGLQGLFIFMALLYLPLLIGIRYIPLGPAKKIEEASNHRAHSLTFRNIGPGLSVLIASGLFFVAQVGVWTFFFDLAGKHVLTEVQVMNTLVISTALSLLGPVASFCLRDKIGRALPLALPALGQIFILYLFAKGGLGFAGFLICASLFQILWNFMLSYAYVVLVDVDVTHRLVSLMPTAQAIGIGAGPLLIGTAMLKNGVWAIAVIGALALILYIAFIIPFAGRRATQRNELD